MLHNICHAFSIDFTVPNHREVPIAQASASPW
jgi:hypothetical protein